MFHSNHCVIYIYWKSLHVSYNCMTKNKPFIFITLWKFAVFRWDILLNEPGMYRHFLVHIFSKFGINWNFVFFHILTQYFLIISLKASSDLNLCFHSLFVSQIDTRLCALTFLQQLIMKKDLSLKDITFFLRTRLILYKRA